MRNGRLVAAVAFPLLAAAAGALTWGLEQPALGAVAAVAGVVSAAVASTGFDTSPPRSSAPPASRPTAPAPSASARTGSPPQAADADPAGVELPAPEGVPTPVADDRDLLAPRSANDLVDHVTGLLDHRYFVVALERRVTASRRKLAPFSLVILELRPEDPTRYRVTDQSMKTLAAVVRAVLRESDTACRIDEHTIGLLLEDTPESGAVWATERVRAGFFATTFRGNVRLAAGIAAYPAHALEPDRLLSAARDAATRSRRDGDERIEIATIDEPSEEA